MPVRLNGATSGYVQLSAPAVAGSTSLELPTDSIKPGLVLIATSDFSAASTVIVNNCFTSTYANYRIAMNASFSTDANPYIQFRASGTNTATNYVSRRADLNATYSSVTLTTGIYIGVGRTSKALFVMDVGGPNVAAASSCLGMSEDGGSGVEIFTGKQTDSTQFDGFTITGNSATMTGSIFIYGYRNSL